MPLAYVNRDGINESVQGENGRARVGGSLISYHWPGAGTGNAPDPTDFFNYTIGADSNAVAGATIYHVVDGAWVSLGVTVAQLHGA